VSELLLFFFLNLNLNAWNIFTLYFERIALNGQVSWNDLVTTFKNPIWNPMRRNNNYWQPFFYLDHPLNRDPLYKESKSFVLD
jgi:hypothetical protein